MSEKQRLITANTRFDQTLLKMIDELEEQKSPEGQYVWKRMEYYAPIAYSGTDMNLVGASMVPATIIYSDEPPIYDPSIQYMRFENGTEFVFDPSVGLSDASFPDNKYVGTLSNGKLSPISGYYHIEYAESVVSDEPVASGVGYDLIIYNYDYYSDLDTRFLDFVTSDDKNAYPDSSVAEDGYYYIKFDPATLLAENIREGVDIWSIIGAMSEGVPVNALGAKVFAVDKFVASSTVNVNTVNIPHSLGKTPEFVLIRTATSGVKSANYMISYVAFDEHYGASYGMYVVQLTNGTISRSANNCTANATYINISNSSFQLIAGTEYEVITAA